MKLSVFVLGSGNFKTVIAMNVGKVLLSSLEFGLLPIRKRLRKHIVLSKSSAKPVNLRGF